MNKEAWISAITAFLISAGGAIGVVLVGDTPTVWQVLAAIVLGLVTAAKDVRSLFKLPPVDKVGVWLICGLLGFALVTSTTGCQSTPAKTAANISDASKITVEAALRAWNDYIPVGKPSLAKQAEVRQAWRKYQAAQLLILDTAIILKQAETAGLDKAEAQQALNAAIAQATTALADLVTLLRQTGVKL